MGLFVVYSALAVLVGLGALGPALAFGGLAWSPWRNVLVNTGIRRIWPGRYVTTKWRVRGHWYRFRDRASSNTLKVAYEEVCKGLYTPQVELRPGDFVLDIGAHVGMFTIPLARENPGVHFIAYEPNQENYACLFRNLQLAGVSNVTPVNAGVWGSLTRLTSVQDDSNTGGSRTSADEAGEVAGFTLEAIRATWNIPRLRVLKMDCEGAEYQAIQTSADLRDVDNLLLEVHGGDYTALLGLVRCVPHHRVQIIQDSHVTIDSAGRFQPLSLGVPA